IAGILENPGKSPARSLLLEMAGELRHRGPDGCGLFLHQAFGMVNTRLSIVDLEGGDQPIPNEDRRYWVVQNGEIYNSPELTEVLREKGHSFRTHCDTEVIVHAYEEWGTDCLSQFNGPFAFAIWDTLRGELFVARDRLGIRPLFIAECKGRLLFASEGKALLRHPDMPRQIDPTGLHE
ncbi:MAG: asparagine synthetase B, partial [Gammaproteobacteria bacterium]|nr:asparagine synthetase B [Gammaproteobacteria bacterium]